MRCRILGLVGSALLVASPAAAQAPDPFEAKVRALAHPRYSEREKAARELEAAGEPALKSLRAAQTSTDEELRARAAVVAEKIDRVVRSKRLLAAPTISLRFDRVPLDQAVAELSRKTGLSLQLDKGVDPKRPVTVDTGEVPFWQAVDAFYTAAGLTEADGPAPAANAPQPGMSGRRLVYMSRLSGVSHQTQVRLVEGKAETPAATGHALRVRALPAGYAQNKYDAATGEVTFHLDVDPAPALTLQEVLGVEVRRAVADDRRALAPAYPAPPFIGPYVMEELLVAKQLVIIDGDLQVGNDAGPLFPVTLKAGGTRPKRLAELEGVVVARVLAPPEPVLTVPDVFGKGKGQSFTADRLTCRVTSADSDAPRPPVVARGVQPGDGRPVRKPPEAPAAAAVRVRVTSTAGAINEFLNFPVQVKGRLRPFIRLNRLSGEMATGAPDFQLRDADGKPLRVLATGLVDSTFDGTTLNQEVQLTFEKPAGGLDGINLSLTARKSVVVELPFVLKDVPLP
ncbi:MAG TPA: hypothetical protein VKD90_25145 [Gemmataceae bacterium]|nr:hypothetical protein [Gemmataceae bacterium]